jgi:hypothetical protein
MFLERGNVAADKEASIDLSSGAEEQDTSGGLRLVTVFWRSHFQQRSQWRQRK